MRKVFSLKIFCNDLIHLQRVLRSRVFKIRKCEQEVFPGSADRSFGVEPAGGREDTGGEKGQGANGFQLSAKTEILKGEDVRESARFFESASAAEDGLVAKIPSGPFSPQICEYAGAG